MPYVVKAAPVSDPAAELFSFDEKTMYGGNKVSAGDEIFIFSSDHQGGVGLVAKGVVTWAERGPGIRVRIQVRRTGSAQGSLGRRELAPFRELTDGQPQTELARHLYRQATNKIAGISDHAAAFLRTYFPVG